MIERFWPPIAEVLGDEWSRSALAAACAGGTFALVALLHAGGLLGSLERTTLDARFQYANRPADADTSIVLAAIDERSISFFRRRMKVGWPWPREYYARLLHYLDEGGARAVVFDVLFSEEDFDRRTVSGEQSDQRFARALAEAGNVALATQLRKDADSVKNSLSSSHLLARPPSPNMHLPTYAGALAPLPAFQKGAAAIGGVNVAADADGVVRRFPLAFRTADSLLLPSIGVAALQAGRPQESRGDGSVFDRLPAAPSGTVPLYWYGPGGVDGVFEDQYISIHALIVSAARMQLGKTPPIPPDRFQGKTVVVGGTAATLHDLHATPVSGRADYPGMEIIATFLSNAYNDHFLRPLPAVWTYVLVLLMAVVGTTVVALRPSRVRGAAAATIGVGAAYLSLAVAMFYLARWWMPVVAPTLALVTGFFAMAVASYAVEGRKRRKLRTVFQRYVSPQVVDEVVQNPDQIDLGGEEVEGTIFFSDIDNFTTAAEELSPSVVVQRLNEHFGWAAEVLLNRRAMVDKFIGDAIMAVFGAPAAHPEHAKDACLAALEMDRILRNRPTRSPDAEPFQCRIGIHTGRIVVGNVGTPERVDYTAIGDAVNVAARLEGANKLYGTRILVSHATYRPARDTVEAREIDQLRLTGKTEPIRIYELLGRTGELSAEQSRLQEQFAEGLRAYRAQEWMQAQEVFVNILQTHPDDGPSAVYRRRAEERSGTSLPASWNGVHEMESGT